jgi:hypothetical protein
MKTAFKLILVGLVFSVIFAQTSLVFAVSPPSLWQYQCVDTMKDSRDNARTWAFRPDLVQLVSKEVAAIKSMGANCMAIGTPYDDEFGPYMKVWVDQAHKQGLKVWFRGNLSGWEGWFSYPLLTSFAEHHQKINHFILFHPSFFKDGDIFTPAPEPEAGKLIGDPRNSDNQKQEYLNFLVDSYNNCVKSFSQIDVKVACGFFSTNGDIAKDILTPDVVSKIGNVVVVDHYVSDPNTLVQDLEFLHNKFNTKIMLGEFGAPIPDLNGEMTEDQQAAYVSTVLKGLAMDQGFIEGVNYWTLTNSSTALYNNDFTPRKAVDVIKNYYSPATVQGTVSNNHGQSLEGVTVKTDTTGEPAVTDKSGNFSVAVPAGQTQLLIDSESYTSLSTSVSASAGQQISRDITLQPKNESWFQKIWNTIKNLFRVIKK